MKISMKKYLGIELGSTRIKAVLIDESNTPVASGAHDWENKLEDGYWTYSLDDVWAGVRDVYAKLATDYLGKYGEPLTNLDGLGFSAMMHGYLAFGEADDLLTPFRTWRNTTTERAAALLTERFGFNIPQRWSIAHLYQAILNDEAHLKDIKRLTTLAGYIHWKLSGKYVLGVGDASGMFPIDSRVNDFDAEMARSFEKLTGIDIIKLMPAVATAGGDAGTLTAAGAKVLDPSGVLQPGAPMCPPEGDAGTGMVATNSVAAHTGNVSAGTSVFAMIVLDNALSKLHTEIDMVTTPTGLPVAMVHCNSCTSDLDAWIKLFGEGAELMGAAFNKSELYNKLYAAALEGRPDGGGLMSFNYYSGEPITGLDDGRPLFTRLPDSRMNLSDFMRALLYSSLATLSLGMDILTVQEQVKLDLLQGHGGLFKTPGVGQRLMAAALNVPVAVQESSAEGGAWGIALLAAYRAEVIAAAYKEKETGTRSFEQFLDGVFSKGKRVLVKPDRDDVEGFRAFLHNYTSCLDIERAAVANLRFGD